MNGQLKNELIDLTADLIRIPSTHSRPESIARCAEFIVDWCDKQNIQAQHTIHNNIPSVTVLPKPTGAPLLFLCHFDVVEADDPRLFAPRLDNNRLYGRGAIDDKYAVALTLLLFREHLRRLEQQGLSQLDMGFGLVFTGDEEVGGKNGAGVLANRLDTEFCITLDGGCPDLVVIREKGILLLELTASGQPAHAARPWLGNSAFDRLIRDYRNLQHLFPESGAHDWKRTMVLSRCEAGNGSTNMVPARAKAILDIRYTEEDDPLELLGVMREVAESEIEVLAMEPVFSGGDSPYLAKLLQQMPDIDTCREHGASDARYFSQKNIPGIIWGADGEMSQHTENEYLLVDSMVWIYQQLDRFLTSVSVLKN